jgi:large subunit ribosomal protein L36e
MSSVPFSSLRKRIRSHSSHYSVFIVISSFISLPPHISGENGLPTTAVSHKGDGLAFPMSKASSADPAAAPAVPPEAKKVHTNTSTAGPRTLVVRDVIREVAGWAPYERRAQDIIKLDKPKLARAYLKKRLGSFDRARRKFLHLEALVREEARQHEHHHAHGHEHHAHEHAK